MSFIRNRVALALIGLLLIGGISAAVAVLTTPQPLRAALVGAGQANAKPTATSAATATTAPSGGGTTTSSEATAATTLPTATTPPSNPPAANGQVIGATGTITSVDVNGGTFTMTVNGSAVKVVVNGSTQYSGDAKSLSQLKPGLPAEVHGIVQANGSLLATEVNADTGVGAGG